MPNSIESLLATGTKLWLDSIDPDLVRSNRAAGVTGATSNPIIVADLLATGRFDADIVPLARKGLDDGQIAWQVTDQLVRDAQDVFLPVWEATHGDDGYVSFEVDPLLEDTELNLAHSKRVAEYVRLGKQWAAGHRNRMIKVPATPAGLDALEDLVAAGVTVNVTLIFSARQYQEAREAVWRGAQRRPKLDGFKSVYSIFVSRLDVYTEKAVPQLSPAAQGMVGILNAKRIWADNERFWDERGTPLRQEIVFASTGTKKPSDPPWKYVDAFAGSDIQTNPPATNDAVAKSGRVFTRHVDELPTSAIVEEIDRLVDMEKLEATLMAEGIAKFANPQKALLAMVAKKRKDVG
jgi:transaldolase